jgi:protein gp37
VGKGTKIEWAHHTFNPYWGCTEVGPECDQCYAREFADTRLKMGLWGANAPRRFFGDAHWNEPKKWNLAAEAANERHRVFCSSMADVMEDRRDLDAQRDRLWKLIDATPYLDWLLLTKRPSKYATLTPWGSSGKWPRNVWAGCTAGTQKTANVLIPQLLSGARNARVKWVSAEPLLERVSYAPFLSTPEIGGVSWIVLGGESNAVRRRARPCNPDWIREAMMECAPLGASPFVKQLGSNVMLPRCRDCADVGPICPGSLMPCGGTVDTKGGNWAEWPPDMRVRRFPEWL